MGKETQAIVVLKDIAMDPQRLIVERQRAVDALTLFHTEAISIFSEIAEKVESRVVRERAELYLQRLKSGADLSMTL